MGDGRLGPASGPQGRTEPRDAREDLRDVLCRLVHIMLAPLRVIRPAPVVPERPEARQEVLMFIGHLDGACTGVTAEAQILGKRRKELIMGRTVPQELQADSVYLRHDLPP